MGTAGVRSLSNWATGLPRVARAYEQSRLGSAVGRPQFGCGGHMQQRCWSCVLCRASEAVLRLASWFSLSMSTKYHVGQDRNENFRISIRYYAAPLTSFWLLSPKQAPGPSSVESTWGGRKRDLQRRIFRLRGTIHRIHNILSTYFGDIGQILDIFCTKAMCHTTSAARVSIQLVSDHLI